MIRLPAGRPVRIRPNFQPSPYWLLIPLLYCGTAWGGEWGREWEWGLGASPYLAMHASDPVHWRPFGPEALQQAQRDGKLIFISSGYFACHWCHVMQRESFRDPRVAELLSRWVPTLIDRELEPALDAAFIDFVRRTQGVAGWPLKCLQVQRRRAPQTVPAADAGSDDPGNACHTGRRTPLGAGRAA